MIKFGALEIGMILANYGIGSIPFGLIVSKIAHGTDPREKGSGNIGATNVLRVVGKKAALLTLVFDLLKGMPLIAVSRQLVLSEQTILLVALAAILGHVFSVFLKFKGGKGVATSFGIILFLAPQVALIALILWGGGVFLGKYSSVGALTAFGALPLLTLFFDLGTDFVIFTVLVTVLIYIRHWSNICRLFQGKEGSA